MKNTIWSDIINRLSFITPVFSLLYLTPRRNMPFYPFLKSGILEAYWDSDFCLLLRLVPSSSTTLVWHHGLVNLQLRTFSDPRSALLLLQILWHAHDSATIAPKPCKVTSCRDYPFPLRIVSTSGSICIQRSTQHCHLHPRTQRTSTALMLSCNYR